MEKTVHCKGLKVEFCYNYISKHYIRREASSIRIEKISYKWKRSWFDREEEE